MSPGEFKGIGLCTSTRQPHWATEQRSLDPMTQAWESPRVEARRESGNSGVKLFAKGKVGYVPIPPSLQSWASLGGGQAVRQEVIGRLGFEKWNQEKRPNQGPSDTLYISGREATAYMHTSGSIVSVWYQHGFGERESEVGNRGLRGVEKV